MVLQRKFKRERVIRDYNSLSVADQKIIDEIEVLLSKLSEEGTRYWEEYYN